MFRGYVRYDVGLKTVLTNMLYMKNANINVRVEEDLLKKAQNLGINLSELVRSALVSEIEHKQRDHISNALKTASKAVKKIGISTIVSDIRQMRDSR